VIGNPPFAGGQKITGLFGTDYRDYLVLYLADARRGSADLCAYFFLRSAQLLRPSGTFGLLAVNTIAEGDTRQVALEAMLRHGVTLFAARPNFEWPGAASVLASAVHATRGPWRGVMRLSGALVPTISAFLSAEEEWSPKPLQVNTGKSFIGSYVLGMGFTMSADDAQALIGRKSSNAEVLFPYLNGEDLNSHPEQSASRWVINFWDWPLDRSVVDASWLASDDRQHVLWLREGHVPEDYPGRVAADFPEILDLVRRLVKPERDRLSGNATAEGRRKKWWLYGRDGKALYHAIGRGHAFARHPADWTDSGPLTQVLALARVTKFVAPALCSPKQVLSEQTVVFATDTWGDFALLISSVHEIWARKNASSLESRLRYLPSEIFETLPRPRLQPVAISEMSKRFATERARWCSTHRRGLTAFYNSLHNPQCDDVDVQSVRKLLAGIDGELLAAYGWNDVKPEHGFHEVASLPENDRARFTISESARLECLRRLAALNRHRWNEEQANAQPLDAARADSSNGRAPGGRPGRPRLAVVTPQPDMFE
jgi:hypothetical protein